MNEHCRKARSLSDSGGWWSGGRCMHFPLQSPEFPVSSFKGTSVDSAVIRQLLLLRKNAFTPRLEGRDWPDSLGSPGSVQSAPPTPHPWKPRHCRGLLHGRALRAGFHRRSHSAVQDPRDTDGHLCGVGVKHMGRGWGAGSPTPAPRFTC